MHSFIPDFVRTENCSRFEVDGGTSPLALSRVMTTVTSGEKEQRSLKAIVMVHVIETKKKN